MLIKNFYADLALLLHAPIPCGTSACAAKLLQWLQILSTLAANLSCSADLTM